MKNIIKIVFLSSLVFLMSCSGFQYNQIKIDDYADSQKNELSKLSISYQDNRCCMHLRGRNYESDLQSSLKEKGVKKWPETNSKCIIKLESRNRITFCPITNIISPITLAIIPYYCRYKYQVNATLLTKNKNPNSQEKYKILKEYQLSDRVDEVWSSLLFLAAVPITPLRKIDTPDQAKSKTYTRISEAIVRQVLNDAKNFKECQK